MVAYLQFVPLKSPKTHPTFRVLNTCDLLSNLFSLQKEM